MNLWMSNFDVGTALLPARMLYLFHYLVMSVKTVVKRAKKVIFAGWIAPKPLIFAIWDPWYDEI